jgi:hypothetical protein
MQHSATPSLKTAGAASGLETNTMTDSKEIERVREIHAALDRAHLHMACGAAGYTVAPHRDPSVIYTYSAEEVNEWPKNKARLERRLREARGEAIAVLAYGLVNSSGAWDWPQKSMHEQVRINATRGLCLYREMLPTEKQPEAVNGLAAGSLVRIDRISPESLIPSDMLGWVGVVTDKDPELGDGRGRIENKTHNESLAWFICPRDLTVLAERPTRTWDRDKYNGLDAATYQQLSTLDKRIAAARADLDRPAPVRFPAEGRSDRALPVSNGFRRGTEPR